MTTPARRHFQRVTAAIAAAATAAGTEIVGGEYERTLVRLRADIQQLRAIESVERKIAQKAIMLPAYAAWVDGVLHSDSGAADEVLPNVMVWRIDTGDVRGALQIGAYILRHGLAMPDRYNRGPAGVLAEEIAEQALRTIKAGGKPDAEALRDALALTEPFDMADEARAKLCKAYGWSITPALDVPEPQVEDVAAALTAVALLRRADLLHRKCGVVRDIENLARYLKRHAAIVTAIEDKAAAPAQDATPPAPDTTPPAQDATPPASDTTASEAAPNAAAADATAAAAGGPQGG